MAERSEPCDAGRIVSSCLFFAGCIQMLGKYYLAGWSGVMVYKLFGGAILCQIRSNRLVIDQFKGLME